MASGKTKVLEHLFYNISNWSDETKTLSKPVITSADLVAAIRYCNNEYGTKLSDKNPANFMKDLVRNDSGCENWPESLRERRFTARQVTRNNKVFAFLPYGPEQASPFPDPYLPGVDTPRIRIQSLTLSLESKDLGRTDESWLLQTVINLRVIETHFALSSKSTIKQIVHLQMSVKLANTEIDALFYAKCQDDTGDFYAIITCEAKQAGERILDMQICEQVAAVFRQKKDIHKWQPSDTCYSCRAPCC